MVGDIRMYTHAGEGKTFHVHAKNTDRLFLNVVVRYKPSSLVNYWEG